MAAQRGLVALAVLCLAASAGAELPPSGFAIGQPFPTLSFADASTGESVSSVDFRGTKLLVAIFASW